ncbi:hypothetical protein KRR40_07940 [Niabella defluvii]|nr:hypothetical protein KRR40_07940 [Niabella sp. I65]
MKVDLPGNNQKGNIRKMEKYLQIHPNDNVCVAIDAIAEGDLLTVNGAAIIAKMLLKQAISLQSGPLLKVKT